MNINMINMNICNIYIYIFIIIINILIYYQHSFLFVIQLCKQGKSLLGLEIGKCLWNYLFITNTIYCC